ncbi:hypothetical protein NHP21005_03160 [Helicobacter sp. NHP21005]|nr:hypothetical protein NHP21005_03160 [Helicobacter sp. NHP21005]
MKARLGVPRAHGDDDAQSHGDGDDGGDDLHSNDGGDDDGGVPRVLHARRVRGNIHQYDVTLCILCD